MNTKKIYALIFFLENPRWKKSGRLLLHMVRTREFGSSDQTITGLAYTCQYLKKTSLGSVEISVVGIFFTKYSIYRHSFGLVRLS